MDKELGGVADRLASALMKWDTTDFWRTWSAAVERGWLEALGYGGDLNKKDARQRYLENR